MCPVGPGLVSMLGSWSLVLSGGIIMYTTHDIEQMDFVDNQIFELIQRLNPTTKEIDWNIEHISKVREALIEVYAHDLQICTEEEFYP
jgi:hypothetical protein